jgi:hypothetical protein
MMLEFHSPIPLPGTVFYEHVQEQLGQKRNWTDSDDLCIMFTAAYTTDFYRAVRDALHAEVDAWRVHDVSTRNKSQIGAMWERSMTSNQSAAIRTHSLSHKKCSCRLFCLCAHRTTRADQGGLNAGASSGSTYSRICAIQ